ncbi:DUF805 domain-containing protein [Brevundimonas sp. FT23028]|uniref:DUF805 domain-containing protein n=1 Tax=Brevundimonas sp. FT23028 TaxID=3393748 RepID=UPI003B589FA5
MANPIKRGFSRLTQFSGRDTRAEFWPYVGVVIAILFVTNFIVMGALMATTFAEMAEFAAQHPDASTVHSGPGGYSVQIDAGHPEAPIPNFAPFFIGFSIMVLIVVLLLAAAVTRRLHDRNMAGFWGLMPVPFLAIAMTIMPMLFNSVMVDPEPRFDLFGLLFVNNTVYMISLVTLVIILAQKGTPGPNRYGAPTAIPEPVNDWGRAS